MTTPNKTCTLMILSAVGVHSSLSVYFINSLLLMFYYCLDLPACMDYTCHSGDSDLTNGGPPPTHLWRIRNESTPIVWEMAGAHTCGSGRSSDSQIMAIIWYHGICTRTSSQIIRDKVCIGSTAAPPTCTIGSTRAVSRKILHTLE